MESRDVAPTGSESDTYTDAVALRHKYQQCMGVVMAFEGRQWPVDDHLYSAKLRFR